MYKPNTIQLELVQGCNRSCSFCGTSGIETKIHQIKKEVLEKQCRLIAESEYNPTILIAGHGEPTLHKNIYSCIKTIKKLLPKQYLQLLTNGHSILKDMDSVGRLFDAGVNCIGIDEYSDNKFNKTALKDYIEEYEKSHNTRVSYEVMGKGSKFYSSRSLKEKRLLVLPAIDECEISINRKLTNHCGAGMPPDTSKKDKRCTKIFRELSFRWDGNVAICCQDFRGEYFVCDMMRDNIKTLDDIWLHQRMESARKILYHEGRKFYPCSICNLSPIRAGLLPDYRGKEDMPFPTDKDYKVVAKKKRPLANIRQREWEDENE